MASSILFLACAVTLALLFLFPAATFAAVILDTDGEPLKNTGAYHILPTGPYGTGGLTAAPIDSHSLPCPLSVKQKLYSAGSPVTISTPARIAILKTGFPLALYFNNVHSDCNLPLRWYVTKEDDENHRYVIVGVEASKFRETYFFKIQEASTKMNKGEHVYNIKFCQITESRLFGTLSNVDEECTDVGFIDGILGITPNKASDFVFKKNSAHEFDA